MKYIELSITTTSGSKVKLPRQYPRIIKTIMNFYEKHLFLFI